MALHTGGPDLPGPEVLLSLDLAGFTTENLSLVYKKDVDGRKQTELGAFKNPAIAKAFAANQPDGLPYHGVERILVITDGNVAFRIGPAVKLFADEDAALEVRKKAVAKLSPEEREILGLGNE
jgi:hypothetical protein